MVHGDDGKEFFGCDKKRIEPVRAHWLDATTRCAPRFPSGGGFDAEAPKSLVHRVNNAS
jgi:hypothetical protein